MNFKTMGWQEYMVMIILSFTFLVLIGSIVANYSVDVKNAVVQIGPSIFFLTVLVAVFLVFTLLTGFKTLEKKDWLTIAVLGVIVVGLIIYMPKLVPNIFPEGFKGIISNSVTQIQQYLP